MPINFTLPFEELVSMCVSLFCGSVLGLEREYRNKSTGLRTIILICLGATVFSIVSHHGQEADDRIAANIITGIGFIGAGVIFKDKLGVLGLTTASVIWVAAAVGMTAGYGEHSLALLITAIVLAVLLFMGRLEQWVNTLPQNLLITITLRGSNVDCLDWLEQVIREHDLNCSCKAISKTEECIHAAFQLRGRAGKIAALQRRLLQLDQVKSFY